MTLTMPEPYDSSLGSPWKMLVALFCATQSTLPCQVFTWNVGMLDDLRIGNSTEVYEQNGMKMAATFWDTRFWIAVFIRRVTDPWCRPAPARACSRPRRPHC